MKQVEMGCGGVICDDLKGACARDADRKKGRWSDGKDHGGL